jgi:hypothetical protein
MNMMTYYELEEDLYIQGRWQLDGPIDDEQRDERDFRQGRRVELRGSLRAPIITQGIALDFTQTVGVVPILSGRIANAIRDIIKDHTQLFPVQIDGHHGFEVLNVTRLVHCVDEERSDFLKWKEEDKRPDLLGHYRMIRRLRLDPARIPQTLHVFRIMGWELPLIVSQAFVDAILPLNPIGPKLELVT